ncbi:MAG TPA: TonB-dependent receptor plug domain-containing protein, partial [Rubrivivax sp.]|nr:TonB-dependent receptor plug domain-containing protein [Rubrivivax sp.]
MAARINRPSLVRSAAALAAAVCCAGGHAQQASNTIVITGRTAVGVSIAGFGDTPLARTPLQAEVFGSAQLKDADVSAMSGLTRLDASVADAYNAEGYWSYLAVRGFTLDNRFNYRRDGLPVNAETAVALDNKERLELLKGTSGIQAGTSSPGGLVNLVVKRPQGSQRSVTVAFKEEGSVLAAVDVGERFGSVGLRFNAAFQELNPTVRNTRGRRSLLALAADFQLAPQTLLQGEIETSHQRQPSVAGFSMLGNQVPAASSIDPRINLNDQPWRQPVEFDNMTASLRLQQRLGKGWNFVAHALQQRLRTDDRTAFPFGVYDPTTYLCPDWCDRYAPDGSFTYWEYISNNERRTSTALQLAIDGRLQTSALQH